MDTGQNQVTQTKLGLGRRLAIPASLCERYGFAPGEPIVIEALDDGLLVKPLEHVIHEVQAYFQRATPRDRLLSEELIAERRVDAERE